MDDDRFVAEFEATTLPPDSFHHRDHVRLAWIYLGQAAPEAALERFSASLRRYATALGQPGLYHATITWAYLLLIAERRAGAPPGDCWEAFAERNADLLTWKPSILERYYRPETLASDRARAGFVLPDRLEGVTALA